MKAAYLIIAITTVALSLPLQAQKKKVTSRPNQTEWIKGVREYKYDMLIKEVGLTKEQQDAFLPLYQQMEEEIFKSNKEVRDLEHKISTSKEALSDLEYGMAAEAMSNLNMVNAIIEAEYFKKFAEILSKKQLFLLKRAESRFAKSIISQTNRKKQ